jgi:hypothetical protein
MAERVCCKCNKKKDMKGGKICEKDHFVCKGCLYSGTIFVSEMKYCPLDETKLR